MTAKKSESFFARTRRKFFKWCINWEIHDRIFPHLNGEKDHGYPFTSDLEMNAQTAELDVQPLLDVIEHHIRNMPRAYGESFRYIMHRDLHERFRMYERVARKAVRPKTCDPRYVATRWEPSH